MWVAHKLSEMSIFSSWSMKIHTVKTNLGSPCICRNGGRGGGSSFALHASFSHRVRGPMVGPQQAMPNLPGGH